jgi:response regulator RpfG family c-di-GMP phosphodiesterase
LRTDATRTRRSLREPLALDEITSMMLGMAGSELHPVLTRNFIHILRILKNPYRAGKGGLP